VVADPPPATGGESEAGRSHHQQSVRSLLQHALTKKEGGSTYNEARKETIFRDKCWNSWLSRGIVLLRAERKLNRFEREESSNADAYGVPGVTRLARGGIRRCSWRLAHYK